MNSMLRACAQCLKLYPAFITFFNLAASTGNFFSCPFLYDQSNFGSTVPILSPFGSAYKTCPPRPIWTHKVSLRIHIQDLQLQAPQSPNPVPVGSFVLRTVPSCGPHLLEITDLLLLLPLMPLLRLVMMLRRMSDARGSSSMSQHVCSNRYAP